MPQRSRRISGATLRLYLQRKGPLLARGIAYSLLVGSMPLMLLTTAAASYFYQSIPAIRQGIEERLTDFLPAEVVEAMVSAMDTMLQGWAEIGIVGILFLLFVSKGIFDSVASGLSGVLGSGAIGHHPWRNHLASSLLTVFSIALFSAIALSASIIDWAARTIPMAIPPATYPLLMRGFTVLLLGVALATIYQIYTPVPLGVRRTLVVSMVIALLWQTAGYFGQYMILISARRRLVYGVFAGTALFLFWLQVFAHMILFGALIIVQRRSDSEPIVDERD